MGPSKKPKKKHDRPSLQLSSSPVSFFFFHGNSAAAALSPVPEIFFSGAVAAGIPGPLCWFTATRAAMLSSDDQRQRRIRSNDQWQQRRLQAQQEKTNDKPISFSSLCNLMEPKSSAYRSKTGSDPFSSPINPSKIRSVRSPSITPIML